MEGAAKQNARRWHDALRRADPKDWDRVSERMIRRLSSGGAKRKLVATVKALESLHHEEPMVAVNITSARPLDEKVQHDLVKRLLGDRRVSVTTKVDPSLIGGVVVRTLDEQWDLSVKHQLERLKRSIVEA